MLGEPVLSVPSDWLLWIVECHGKYKPLFHVVPCVDINALGIMGRKDSACNVLMMTDTVYDAPEQLRCMGDKLCENDLLIISNRDYAGSCLWPNCGHYHQTSTSLSLTMKHTYSMVLYWIHWNINKSMTFSTTMLTRGLWAVASFIISERCPFYYYLGASSMWSWWHIQLQIWCLCLPRTHGWKIHSGHSSALRWGITVCSTLRQEKM